MAFKSVPWFRCSVAKEPAKMPKLTWQIWTPVGRLQYICRDFTIKAIRVFGKQSLDQKQHGKGQNFSNHWQLKCLFNRLFRLPTKENNSGHWPFIRVGNHQVICGPTRIANMWKCVHAIMMTSSNGFFSTLLALCAGNSPATGEFPSQRLVTRSLMFPLICAWTNGWVNNRDAGGLRRHGAHHDVTLMMTSSVSQSKIDSGTGAAFHKALGRPD